MSAAGVKQSRQGTEGSKPSRGSRNPEDGTQRAGKTRDPWTFDAWCAEGTTSSREEPDRCGGRARARWAKLYRTGQARRELARLLNCSQRRPRRKHRTAGATANGTAGSPNPWRRYRRGPEAL